MFKKITSVLLALATVFAGSIAAQAAAPTAAYATYYDSLSLSTPAAGSVVHIVGTDLDQVTGAKYVGFSPAFAAISATVTEQTATSLTVSVPLVSGVATSQLYLTTSSGDVLVGYFQHVGATKITSSISLRSQVSMPATARVADAPRDLSAYAMVNVTNMAAGTMPVTYTTNNPSICAIVAKTLTFTGVGTCTLTAQLLETNGVAASNTVTKDIVVSAAAKAQTITAPAVSTMNTVIGKNFTLSATASSGLPVTYSSSTNSVCFVISGNVFAVNLGTCTITVTQVGDASWAAATPYVYNLTITATPVAGVKTDANLPLVPGSVKKGKVAVIGLNGLKGTAKAGANADGLPTVISVAAASKAYCTLAPLKEKTRIVAYLVKGVKVGSCQVVISITGNTFFNKTTKTVKIAVTK